MTTTRSNTCSSSSARYSGLRHRSSTSAACALASTAVPQCAHSETASTSSGAVISSKAISSGDMVLSSMSAACRFAQFSSTSVHLPTANCGAPSSECRDLPALVRHRDRMPRLRHQPHPFAQQRRLAESRAATAARTLRGAFRTDPRPDDLVHLGDRCRATRRLTDDSPRTPITCPLSSATVPHSPSRCPPPSVTNPCRRLSA